MAPQSARNASTGATFNARLAGTKVAASTAVKVTAITLANAIGSVALTPKSMPSSRRVSPESAEASDRHADHRQPHAAADDERDDVGRFGAERQPDPDLARALRDEVGHQVRRRRASPARARRR